MRPHSVVMTPPALNDDLGFAKCVEDFAVKQLVAQASIEALDVAILPWTAPLDVSGLGADRSDPVLHGVGDDLDRSGRRRMHDPSVSHRRPRFGFFCGTFRPSRFQIRSTRPSLSDQPAWRSRAAILR